MAPNRSISSTPSPSKKRKVKHGNGNSGLTLDTFFRKASHKLPSTESANDSRHALSSKSAPKDDDAIALNVASEEGVTIESLKVLGQKWKPNQSSPLKGLTPEIIDVDSIESDDASGNVFTDAPDRNDGSNLPREPKIVVRKELFSQEQDTSVDAASFPDLSEDPLCFSVIRCPWSRDTGPSSTVTPYSFIAYILSSLSSTKSRIAITNILTNSLRLIIYHDPSALLPTIYLLSNSLAPAYTPIELGLGPSIISKAIQHVSGLTPAALRRLYTKYGDAGDAAFEAKSNLRPLFRHPPLSVANVYGSLLKICHSKGEGATKQRQSIAEKLLVSAKGEEVRYLVRTMSQHIRVGAVRTSILTALARALVLTRPANCRKLPSDDSPYFASSQFLSLVETSARKGEKKEDVDPARTKTVEKWLDAEALLKRVYVQHPSFDHITEAILEGGLEGLACKVKLTVGIPLHPMLGSPTRSLEEVYDRLGNLPFTAEFKYDGQRAQIHARKNDDGDLLVRIFSRHLEEMTDKYPDITALVGEIFKASAGLRSFIIDTEIVAIDALDGTLKTFQELSNRARKDVRLEDIKIKVCIFAFDLMYLNEESLLEHPFRARRQQLRAHLPPVLPTSPFISKFDHVDCCESEDGREAVEEFWLRAVDSRSEGLMIKLLDSADVLEDSNGTKVKRRRKPLPATYEPDKRTSAWLKLKKDYVLDLGDSLDLVPIGAWHGNGRKAAWWSPILLAVWDESAGQLVGVCKCMSGFTDEFYKSLNDRYPENSAETCSRTSLWNVNAGGYMPEVYFKPQEVWEIRGADITLSPVSVAALGLVSHDRGLSLRFPRFIRVREDKGITNASTPDFVASMWRRQEARGKDTRGMDDGDLIDASPEVSEVEEDEEDD